MIHSFHSPSSWSFFIFQIHMQTFHNNCPLLFAFFLLFISNLMHAIKTTPATAMSTTTTMIPIAIVATITSYTHSTWPWINIFQKKKKKLTVFILNMLTKMACNFAKPALCHSNDSQNLLSFKLLAIRVYLSTHTFFSVHWSSTYFICVYVYVIICCWILFYFLLLLFTNRYRNCHGHV